MVNRPSIFNTSSEESITSKQGNREVFIQDQNVRVNSPITQQKQVRPSKKKTSKLGSKNVDKVNQSQQEEQDSKKVEVNTTDQSTVHDNDPNLLINSFPNIVKFPRSPRDKSKDSYDPNLNSDLAPVQENDNNNKQGL